MWVDPLFMRVERYGIRNRRYPADNILLPHPLKTIVWATFKTTSTNVCLTTSIMWKRKEEEGYPAWGEARRQGGMSRGGEAPEAND
jgi:hypothetical protein